MLTRSLYKSILKKAKLFDARPELKVLSVPPELSFFMNGKHKYYTPTSTSIPFQIVVRHAFRDKARKDTDLSLAFSVLRGLNTAYERSMPKAEEGTREHKSFDDPYDRELISAFSTIGPGTILLTQPMADEQYTEQHQNNPFYHSSTLICSNFEDENLGYILTKPLAANQIMVTYAHYLKHNERSSTESARIMSAIKQMPWFYGGPVHTPSNMGLVDKQWVGALHCYDHIVGSIQVQDGLYYGGSFEQICSEVLSERIDPTKIRMFLGHASWKPGQLQDEISRGQYVTAKAARQLILPSTVTKHSKMWSEMLQQMGGEYASLVRAAGILKKTTTSSSTS